MTSPVRRVRTEHLSSITSPQPLKKPFDLIPNMVISQAIFPYASFKENFLKLRLVSVKFNQLAKDPTLLYSHIQNDIAYGSRKLHNHFPLHFPWSCSRDTQLPFSIVETLLSPCPLIPNQRLIETHYLVWIRNDIPTTRQFRVPSLSPNNPLDLDDTDKENTCSNKARIPTTQVRSSIPLQLLPPESPLTLNNLLSFNATIKENSCPNRCAISRAVINSRFSEDVVNSHGDSRVSRARWVLIAKQSLLKSKNKSYPQQINLLQTINQRLGMKYIVPKMAETVYCIWLISTLNLRHSPERGVPIRPSDSCILQGTSKPLCSIAKGEFTFCPDYSSSRSARVIIGSYVNGIGATLNYTSELCDKNIGLIVMRELEIPKRSS